jgi:hypothetical protein
MVKVAIPVYKDHKKADDLGIENDGTRALYEALKKVDYFGLRTYDEYCYFDSSHLISSANRKYQSVQQELLDYCLGKRKIECV